MILLSMILPSLFLLGLARLEDFLGRIIDSRIMKTGKPNS